MTKTEHFLPLPVDTHGHRLDAHNSLHAQLGQPDRFIGPVPLWRVDTRLRYSADDLLGLVTVDYDIDYAIDWCARVDGWLPLVRLYVWGRDRIVSPLLSLALCAGVMESVPQGQARAYGPLARLRRMSLNPATWARRRAALRVRRKP